MIASPVLVDAFAGGGGFWLAAVGADLTPPVSWMGGKRKLAADLLALLGLHRGCGVPLLLGDSSWWGWVWPAVLDADTGPRVSAILRGWRGEDPRALWFRLRDMGPVVDDVAGAAAQLLWLQARAASGVPVWWEGGEGRMWDRTRAGNVGPMGQMHATEPRLVAGSEGSEGSEGCRTANAKGAHGGPGRLLQFASTQIDEAGQSRTSVGTTTAPESQQRLTCDRAPTGLAGGGGIVDPGTVADRLDRIRGRLVKGSGGEAGFGYDDGVRRGKGWRLFEPADVADRLDTIRGRAPNLTIEHAGALDLTQRWAPVLGDRALVYLDPPYAGRTGYPCACPREEVLAIAELWARHGARVVLSEAVGLATDLGPGWNQVCLRAEPKPEWATVYRCDVRAVLPPLLRAVAV